MVIVHRYLAQLHKPDPAKKRDINSVLVYCWGSVADDDSILNRIWINMMSAIEGGAFIVCAITSYTTL